MSASPRAGVVDGVVISDDLEMAGIALKAALAAGAVAALRASCDLLIASRILLPQRDLPGLLEEIRRAIAAGEIPPEQVATALRRVRRLREGLNWRADPAAARAVLRMPAQLALLEEVQRRAVA